MVQFSSWVLRLRFSSDVIISVESRMFAEVIGEGQSDAVMSFKMKIINYRMTQQLLSQLLLSLVAHNRNVGLSFLNYDHRGTLYKRVYSSSNTDQTNLPVTF